jgi:hypothetical protein
VRRHTIRLEKPPDPSAHAKPGDSSPCIRNLLDCFLPLVHEDGCHAAGLTDAEIAALWELASTREETLRLRFITEGIQNAATTRQLRNGAALAVHATVGLDWRRRAEVERQLGERLAAEGIAPEQQIDLALTLAALGGLSAASASSVVAMLNRAMARTADRETLLSLSQGLSAVASRMEPEKAAAALIQAMNSTKDGYALWQLSKDLSALAARMEAGKATEACAQATATLTQTMNTTKEQWAFYSLAQGLSAVAACRCFAWVLPGAGSAVRGHGPLSGREPGRDGIGELPDKRCPTSRRHRHGQP